MILPYSVKVGPVEIKISQTSSDSYQLSGDSVDFEYTRKCWDELRNLIDGRLEEEFVKFRSAISQNAKIRLGIEVLNILSRQAVPKDKLINELIKTGKFSREQAMEFLQESVRKEIVYPDENGFYTTN